MQLPGWSTDTEAGKKQLAARYAGYERMLLNECAGLAKSGFADKRVAANAFAKFEEAFLLLRKALRIADELADPNDYGKAPVDPNQSMPDAFTPRPDPAGAAGVGDRPGTAHRHQPQFILPKMADDDG